MKHIAILRHGESNSNISDDRARSLTQKGSDDITRLSTKLLKLGSSFDYHIYSPVRRAANSFDIISSSMGLSNDGHQCIELYDGELDDIIQEIESVSDKYHRLLIVGHNPIANQLVSYLSSEAGVVFNPPGSFFMFELNITSWEDLQPNQGYKVTEIIPDSE